MQRTTTDKKQMVCQKEFLTKKHKKENEENRKKERPTAKELTIWQKRQTKQFLNIKKRNSILSGR